MQLPSSYVSLAYVVIHSSRRPGINTGTVQIRCRGQRGTGTRISPGTSIFPCQYHSICVSIVGRRTSVLSKPAGHRDTVTVRQVNNGRKPLRLSTSGSILQWTSRFGSVSETSVTYSEIATSKYRPGEWHASCFTCFPSVAPAKLYDTSH
jgi:hypothetical protein